MNITIRIVAATFALACASSAAMAQTTDNVTWSGSVPTTTTSIASTTNIGTIVTANQTATNNAGSATTNSGSIIGGTGTSGATIGGAGSVLNSVGISVVGAANSVGATTNVEPNGSARNSCRDWS